MQNRLKATRGHQFSVGFAKYMYRYLVNVLAKFFSVPPPLESYTMRNIFAVRELASVAFSINWVDLIRTLIDVFPCGAAMQYDNLLTL